MKWASLAEFMAMGGYGLYVWGSYVVTALLIGVEIFLLMRRHRVARGRLSEPDPARAGNREF
jgi:heme exporter protein D